MNRLAAAGRIAVCFVFSIGLSAQTLTFTPSGSNGRYTLTARYDALAEAHLPTGNVAFEDTTYSNAVLASAPLSLTASGIWAFPNQSFPSVSNYYSYSNVLARDFDGDGKVDLLFIDSTYHLVFLKGNGDRTFQNGVTESSVSMQTTFLTAGDWDGDGKLDIAASGTQVNSSSGPANAAIQVRRGNGDGTFQVPVQLTDSLQQTYQQASLQTGDFNGDGKLDLYSAATTSSSLSTSGHLYLGNGDGTFATAVATMGALGPAADFNNDGRTDICGARDSQGGYATLLGLSNGTFQVVNSSPAGVQTTVADFNGDGKLDLATLSGTFGSSLCCGSAAVVSLGNGDGTFQTASRYVIDPNYYQWAYTSSTSGDFNGDGVPDLAFLGWNIADRYLSSPVAMLTLLFGHPDGTFSPKQNYNIPLGTNSGQILSVDTNGDGLQEAIAFYQGGSAAGFTVPTFTNVFAATATNVAVSPSGTHQVRAHYAGDANYPSYATATQALAGSDAPATLSLTVTPNPSTYLATVDMTVTVTPCTVGSYSCNSDFVTIYDGSTVVTTAYPSGGVAHATLRTFSQGTHVITASFAGNSHLSSGTSNAVTLTVGPPAGIVGTLTLTEAPESQDSHTLAAQFSSSVLTTAPTGNVSFLDLTANNNVLATATFGSPVPMFKTDQTPMSENYNTTSLYAGDFDNDGKADLIYPSGGSYISFLHGNGDGTFSGTEATGGSGTAAIADFNNDGKLDVIQNSSYNMVLFKGNGDGTFTFVRNLSDSYGNDASPLAGDFNDDGKQDVYNITSKNVFFGNGDGTFQSATATNITAQLAGDFNQDGRTDLFTTSGVYLGQANGTFVAVPAPSAYSNGVLVFDFNHDGKLDVFTADKTLLLGNGDGSFQAPKTVDLSTELDSTGTPNDVKYFTGDFNGDGKADVGLLETYANGGPYNTTAFVVVVTFGDGTGAFTNKTTYNTSTRFLQTIPSYLPDFNGDAASDIAVYYQTPDVSTWPPNDNWLTVLTTPTVYTATATGVALFAPPANRSIQAQYPGDVNYLDATSNTVSLFARTPVTLTLAVNPNPANVGQSVTFTATLSPFTDSTHSTNGEEVDLYDGSTLWAALTLSNGVVSIPISWLPAGSHSITAKFAGDSEFSLATSAPISLQINRNPVNVTWSTPSAITYGTALSAAQLNASTTIAGTFDYSPTGGTALSAGSQTLSTIFTPDDTATYSNANATTTLMVNKATPSIAVTQTSPATTGTYVGTATTLRAVLSVSWGSPAGAITFYDGSTAIGTAPVSSLTATLTTIFSSDGTHVITAIYSGDNNFNTVTSPAFDEVVSKITPSITWTTPAAITYGAALSATQLHASSAVAGTFVYSPAAGAVLGAGPQTLSVTFTPTDTTTYNSTTATTTLVVNKATPSVSWSTPAAITYGTPLSVTQLKATSSVAGTFAYSPAAGTLLGVGSQTLSVTFTPTDATNYNSISSTTTLTVNKATPSVTWSTPAAITYGTALSATQLNATSAVAGTFVYTPAAGAVLGGGSQTLSVTFTPTDTTTYNSTTATTTLMVNKATPSVSWSAPAAITYGTPLSATQLNATSSVAGAFAYSPAAGTVPGGGSQTLSTIFTPTDTADYNSATGSTTLLVNKATPSITVTQTSPVTIGVGTGVATTFRAALAASYGTPTGTVGFYEGTTLLGSAPLISGAASVTTTFSTTGVHTITALYTGDANFNTVTSAAFNETVVLFGIGLAANPTTLTIKQGQSGTATVTATPTGNYTGTLTFSCGNLPSSVSCSFAPATLTFNGDNQPQSTTITVSTRTTSAALMSTSNMRLASILTLPLLAFGLRRRRMLQRGLMVLFAAMLLLPATGCGGNPTTSSNSAATGQQTVTINAQTTANGGSTQSFNFSIIIEP